MSREVFDFINAMTPDSEQRPVGCVRPLRVMRTFFDLSFDSPTTKECARTSLNKIALSANVRSRVPVSDYSIFTPDFNKYRNVPFVIYAQVHRQRYCFLSRNEQKVSYSFVENRTIII